MTEPGWLGSRLHLLPASLIELLERQQLLWDQYDAAAASTGAFFFLRELTTQRKRHLTRMQCN